MGEKDLDKFLCIQAFVRVAETQSFTSAARQLDVCPSVVSTRVRQLEKLIQASLFHRSTRMVTLSETGQGIFDDCAELVNRIEQVIDNTQLARGSVSGTLRIQVLPGFEVGHFGRALQDFRAEYPQISLDVVVSDESLNPVEESFDVAFQVFHPRAESLIVRALFPVRRVFCASPQYLRDRPLPKVPQDLAEHELGLYSGYPTRSRRIFQHRSGEEVSVELPEARIRSNSVPMLRDFALAGLGICCLPTLVCSNDLMTGALVPLLPEYELHPKLQLCATYPSTHRGARKVRLLIDFIGQRFTDRPWDRALDAMLGQADNIAA